MTFALTSEEQKTRHNLENNPILKGNFRSLSDEETRHLDGLPGFYDLATSFKIIDDDPILVPAGGIIILSKDRSRVYERKLHFCTEECQLTGTGYYLSVNANEYAGLLNDNGSHLPIHRSFLMSAFLRSTEVFLAFVVTFIFSTITFMVGAVVFSEVFPRSPTPSETVLEVSYIMASVVYFILLLKHFAGFTTIDEDERQASHAKVFSWIEAYQGRDQDGQEQPSGASP